MRLFLVAIVLQKFVLDQFGVPFWLTVVIAIMLIWVYTYRGGIKTIVWTDTLQTVCMLTAVVLTISAILKGMNLNFGDLLPTIRNSEYSQLFFFEGGWGDSNNFFKQFSSGALLAIVMTGLDQDMMQKNLTCKTLADAQKNMFTFSVVLVFANLLFLSMGALMYIFAKQKGIDIPARPDQLYPTLALEHLSPFVGIVFLLGLIAAAYSSADSALTSLTTSFCVDFLNFKKSTKTEEEKKKTRLFVHIGFSIILLLVILIVKSINRDSIINELFVAAGFTYGPLLGLFSFGLFTNRVVKDKFVLWVCLAAPLISFVLNKNSAVWFNGLEFGFTILAVNGLLTFLGLWFISTSAKSNK
jgi:Na+/proline symporter